MFKKRLAKGHISKPLKELPKLSKKLDLIWRAFQTLNQTRGSGGFSVSPIEYSTIISYLDENEIDNRNTRRLYIECFLAMDEVIIKHANSKQDEYKQV